MSTTGRIGARGRLYLDQRFPRLRRRLPPLLLGLVGAIALASGVGRETPEAVLVGMACLPLWTLALSWPVWRAPEEGLPQLMRWRSFQRRVCGRLTVLLLMGAGVAVMLIGYFSEQDRSGAQHAWTSAAVRLAVLSPAPLLLDPLLWRAWTYPFRGAVRSARTLMLLQEPQRFLTVRDSRRPAPGFDPDEGFCGRPVPLRRNVPPPRRGRRYDCHRRTGEGVLVTVSWDGVRALTFSVAGGQSVRIPIEQVGELVSVTETGPRDSSDLFLVLDREGRRLVTMERAGLFGVKGLTQLAARAGLPFTVYELGYGDGLTLRLFPCAQSHQRVVT